MSGRPRRRFAVYLLLLLAVAALAFATVRIWDASQDHGRRVVPAASAPA